MSRTFHIDGLGPPKGHVFVFGSNLSGIHGAGAAKAAHQQHGAQWGVYEGLTGESYALPTVKREIKGPLRLDEINFAVDRFIKFANEHPEMQFFVTKIGCGLAGRKDSEIAPMFLDAPENCSLPDAWEQFLTPKPVYNIEAIAKALAETHGWEEWDEATNAMHTPGGNEPEEERKYYRDTVKFVIAALEAK